VGSWLWHWSLISTSRYATGAKDISTTRRSRYNGYNANTLVSNNSTAIIHTPTTAGSFLLELYPGSASRSVHCRGVSCGLRLPRVLYPARITPTWSVTAGTRQKLFRVSEHAVQPLTFSIECQTATIASLQSIIPAHSPLLPDHPSSPLHPPLPSWPPPPPSDPPSSSPQQTPAAPPPPQSNPAPPAQSSP